MAKQKITRAIFEKTLNSNSPRFNDPLWFIGGKRRLAYASSKKYGTALRTYDKIQFEVLFKEWANKF